MSQKSLKTAFEARSEELKRLKDENTQLAEKHAQLNALIKEARLEEQKQKFDM